MLQVQRWIWCFWLVSCPYRDLPERSQTWKYCFWRPAVPQEGILKGFSEEVAFELSVSEGEVSGRVEKAEEGKVKSIYGFVLCVHHPPTLSIPYHLTHSLNSPPQSVKGGSWFTVDSQGAHDSDTEVDSGAGVGPKQCQLELSLKLNMIGSLSLASGAWIMQFCGYQQPYCPLSGESLPVEWY